MILGNSVDAMPETVFTHPMTSTTASAYKITFHRSSGIDGRYYVHLDGEKVGWVCRYSDDRTWAFYACTRRWAEGERLTYGNATRRDAVMDGLSHLRIYNLGRVVRLDDESLDEVVHYFDNDRLDATWQAQLDAKYPMAVEA